MTAAPRRRGRPPNPVVPEPIDPVDDGLTMRFRAIMASAADVMERKMAEFGSDLSDEQAMTAAKLGNEAGVLLGQARRHDESMRGALKKISLEQAIKRIEVSSPDEKAHAIERLKGGEDTRNVLG